VLRVGVIELYSGLELVRTVLRVGVRELYSGLE